MLLTCRLDLVLFLLTNQKIFHKKINTTSTTLSRVFETKKNQKIVNMPKKEVYLSKAQIQRLCELYQQEEHLWNIQSPHYFKKDKKTGCTYQN